MNVVPFPHFRLVAIFVLETIDGCLVLAPGCHGWLHATLSQARAEAQALSHKLSLRFGRPRLD